jgi:hypothetical protein
MLLKIKYTAFALLFFISLRAQTNLVPNPSFEEYSLCPNGTGQFTVNDWYSANDGSPDYFNICSSNDVDIPTNNFGYQNAFHGDGYIGARIHNENGTFLEYVGCQLIQQLNYNKVYYISFYLSLADISEFSTNNFSVFFSNEYQFYNTSNNILEVPQIIYSNQINDTINWKKISIYYIANGTERFMILGNFLHVPTVEIKSNNNTNGLSYMYIDSISIIETKIPAVYSDVVLYPNPTTEVLNISMFGLNTATKTLKIYNSIGQLIFMDTINSDTYTLNTASLSSGVYTITVLDNKKYLAKKKFVVIN